MSFRSFNLSVYCFLFDLLTLKVTLPNQPAEQQSAKHIQQEVESYSSPHNLPSSVAILIMLNKH